MKTATNMFLSALAIVLIMLVSSTAICAAGPGQTEVDQKLAELKSTDSNIRSFAAQYFFQHDVVEVAYEPLLNGLTDKDGAVRLLCAQAITKYRNKDSFPAMVKYLDLASKVAGPNEMEVGVAMQGLTLLDADKAQPIINESLASDNLKLKNSAIAVIGLMLKDIPRITPYLDDNNASTRQVVFETLGKIGTPEAFALRHKVYAQKRSDGDKVAIMELLSIYDNSDITTNLYINALHDDDPIIRAKAADMLNYRNNDKIADLLLELLANDPDATVRKQAIKSMAHRNNIKIIPALIAALKDNSIGVRAAAAEMLGNDPFIDKAAFKPLLAALQDEASNVTARAAHSLGAYKDKDAIEPLIAVLESGDNLVRNNVAISLFALGGDDVIDDIGPAMSYEKNAYVLRTMISIMIQMTDKVAAAKYIETAARNFHKDNQKIEAAMIGAHIALTGESIALK